MPSIPQKDVWRCLREWSVPMVLTGRMEDSAKNGFTNATDAADYLVNHGVPFRDAHGIVGRLVLLHSQKYCE